MAKSESSEYVQILVGSAGYFDAPEPDSVFLVQLSLADGALSCVGEPISVGAANPGWLTCKSSSSTLYIAYELAAGKVQGFKMSSAPGTTPLSLEPLGEAVSTVGRAPCHLMLDETGRWLFAANYVEGSVSVLPILEDGSVGKARDSKMHQGHDRIPAELYDRQERPHCHQVNVHPSNKWVVVSDLGVSSVLVYEFNAELGALIGAADDPRHLVLEPGAGCRHARFNSTGDRLYVNNELTCTVTVCQFDAESGNLTALQTIPTLPSETLPKRDGHWGNSDIHVHPNGRFLYVGCRSADPGLLTVFGIDADGKLSLIGHHSTRGTIPRNFKLVGDGKWLVVGNQESKTIVSFAVDSETGKLEFVSEVSTSLKPCNICPISDVHSTGLKRKLGS